VHGPYNLYFKFHVHGRTNFYGRPDMGAQAQVVHLCPKVRKKSAWFLE